MIKNRESAWEERVRDDTGRVSEGGEKRERGAEAGESETKRKSARSGDGGKSTDYIKS